MIPITLATLYLIMSIVTFLVACIPPLSRWTRAAWTLTSMTFAVDFVLTVYRLV